MKKRVKIILIILIAIFAIYYIAKALFTKHYQYTHEDKLQIDISLTEVPGLGQSGGYNIEFGFENKKNGNSITFYDGNDRFWYEFFIQNITIENVKKKTIVIHDLDYGNYVFVDYHSLKQRSKHLFDFNGSIVLDSNNLILQELNTEPIWIVGCHWQDVCDK
ncbi:MAG: hypothetical protein HRT58_22540 [Crocinitomicaceae bacterium]|nr:hypothetical protein [Flavobacteriales bacterium]NQZ38457.1 hypothetical protein [Crocinitomicaceae bacterium]